MAKVLSGRSTSMHARPAILLTLLTLHHALWMPLYANNVAMGDTLLNAATRCT